MTLNITSKEDEQRQLAVTIEVAEDRLKKAMKKAARKLAKQVKIPGFRPGKAPYSVVNGYFGDESIRQEALQDMLPGIYDEMLKKIEVQPSAQPTLDEVEHKPMVLKMTVPLEPTVVLGDYRAMRRDIDPVEVKDDAVDEAIDTMRQQRAETETVERAAALEDLVTISGTGHVDGDEENVIFKDENGFETKLVVDGVFPGTTFAENIVGLSAGDEKQFTVEFGDDFDDEDLAGKVGNFSIKVVEVKESTLPELDDAFAKEASGDEEKTLELFRVDIAENLQKQAENQFKNDLVEEAVTDMLENVEELVYPPQLVEAQIDDMMAEMKQRVEQAQIPWADFIGMREGGEQGMRDEYEDGAVERVERGLIFQNYLVSEQITISAEEEEAALEKRLEEYDESFRDMMRQFLVGQGGAMVRQELLMDKVYERTVVIYEGNAPDLSSSEGEKADEGEEKAEVKAKAKPKKKAKAKAKKKKADPKPATESDESEAE